MELKKKMYLREIASAIWILLLTFLIGLPIVFIEYGDHHKFKEILLFLYLFLEFLPMILYLLAIFLTQLSPHLLLPWIIINAILILLASIFALSLSLPTPTLINVLLALGISVLIIFPVICIIIMFLPVIVYTKKLVPNYKRKVKRTSIYRKITGTKTAEEIEREIIERRKEHVKNVVITDRDFEQFIYVNKAAQKWKTKWKKSKEPEEELKDILEEGNITVNESCEKLDENVEIENGNVMRDRVTANKNPDTTDAIKTKPPSTTVSGNGKFVTDV